MATTHRYAGCATALLAGVWLAAAGGAHAQCPCSSVQTRVQLNESYPWSTGLTLPQRESFRVAAFYNGTGQFASPACASVAVTLPSGQVVYPGIGGYVQASLSGTYSVTGTCSGLSETVYVGATGTPRYIWDISAEVGSWRFTQELDKIRDAGATATHLSFNWDVVEPTAPGVRNWAFVDTQWGDAAARGLTGFAYTGSSPKWALPNCNPNDPGDPDCNPAFPPSDAYRTAFESFHRDLASRLCGKVRYYEFWNEPNGCGFRTPAENNCNFTTTKMREYVKWLVRWYKAMKQGCSSAVLSFGGFDCHAGVDCVSQINTLYSLIASNAEGGCLNNCFDAASIHPYGSMSTGNELNWAQVDGVSQALCSRGQWFKLLWLDEWAIDYSDSRAGLVASGLNRLDDYWNVFEARYLRLTDVDPNQQVRPYAGLMNNDLTPRRSYTAFQQHAQAYKNAGQWRGSYWSNIGLSGAPAQVRDDGANGLYFNWGGGAARCDLPSDNFSADWIRWAYFPAGTYRFTARADDGVLVWVDGVNVINGWRDQAPTVYMADRTFSTSGYHQVEMAYYERGGGAVAQLSWPVVSSVVCANLSESSCNAQSSNCQWFGCAGLCLPKNTPDPPTCSCAAYTSVSSCDANASAGCAWYYCRNKCLATGTSVYSVCGTGTP